MLRVENLSFSPGEQYVARRAFTLNGKNYAHGEPVDLSGLAERRCNQMLKARQILPARLMPPMPAKPEVSKDAAKNPPRKGATAAPGASGGEAGGSAPTSGAAPAGGAPRAVHKGFGRWFVVDASGKETGPMSKAEALERAKP